MDEMQIVEFYLYLSSERFKDRVKYEIIWEKESLKECFIPKLSVEPIVENAVIHGIEPKSDLGFIQVRVSEDGPTNDNPNAIFQVGDVFGFSILIDIIL